MNLLVLIAIGVILADLVANAPGTNSLFNGIAGMWKVGVNGMLGKAS